MGRVRPGGSRLVELLAQRAPFGGGEPTLLVHQEFDEVAVTTVGGHAASRRVWLRDQASLFERRQFVAHRSWREIGLVLAGDQIRRHGLSQHDVFLDNVAKDAFSAGGQLGQGIGQWLG
jgi:hypothetical protein